MKPREEEKPKKMSKADRMFEELGYEYNAKIYQFCANVYDYKNDKTDKWIRFDGSDRKIIFMTQNSTMYMQELKAINKKCEELGWI